MSVLKFAPAALAALILSLPAQAGDTLMIHDPYARASSPMAKAGAAFMVIVNPTGTDDRLVSVTTDAAARAELHTHVQEENGVMRMTEIEGGIPIPAGGETRLERGGLHVMLMGLTGPLETGDSIGLTLTFETAGEITIPVPVDNDRLDPSAHGHDRHGG